MTSMKSSQRGRSSFHGHVRRKGLARWLAIVAIVFLFLPSPRGDAAEQHGANRAPPELKPGLQFSIAFPHMPPTLAMLAHPNKKEIDPMITVFLPLNYDPHRKHPLLVYLRGGAGFRGDEDPDVARQRGGIARQLCDERDFVCVNMPLFKLKFDPNAKSAHDQLHLGDEDAKFAWPFYKRMLAKLDTIVPNIDPKHRIIGGMSNGAHMTGGLINQSHGEFVRHFSAFYLLEGGFRVTWDFNLVKRMPLFALVGSESEGKWEGMQRWHNAIIAAGVKLTYHEMEGVGHKFPQSEYPRVTDWLRKTLLMKTSPASDTPKRTKKKSA